MSHIYLEPSQHRVSPPKFMRRFCSKILVMKRTSSKRTYHRFSLLSMRAFLKLGHNKGRCAAPPYHYKRNHYGHATLRAAWPWESYACFSVSGMSMKVGALILD